MKTVVIIQARMSSTRFAGKVLMELSGAPVLGWCVRAARAIKGVDEVVVATSVDSSDDAINAWCQKEKVVCVRGSLHDVLDRYGAAARHVNAGLIMRITSDCPLLDPSVCADVIQLCQSTGSVYASNIGQRTWPQGLDCEVFTAEALYRVQADATLPYEREHVTPYMRNHPELFKAANLLCPIADIGLERWTLDTAYDYAFLQKIVMHYHRNSPPSYTDILDILKHIPEPHNRNPKVAL
jgi:spore coat polysaccharide biosynthesis protein SpsF (cytidylyltransferase family)